MLHAAWVMFARHYACQHNVCPMRAAWQLKASSSQVDHDGQFCFCCSCVGFLESSPGCGGFQTKSGEGVFNWHHLRCWVDLRVEEWQCSAASFLMKLCRRLATKRTRRRWRRHVGRILTLGIFMGSVTVCQPTTREGAALDRY